MGGMEDGLQRATDADVIARVTAWQGWFPMARSDTAQELRTAIPVSYLDALYPVTVPMVYEHLITALVPRLSRRRARQQLVTDLARAESFSDAVVHIPSYWEEKQRDKFQDAFERRLMSRLFGYTTIPIEAAQRIVQLGYLLSTETPMSHLTEAQATWVFDVMNTHEDLIRRCAIFAAQGTDKTMPAGLTYRQAT